MVSTGAEDAPEIVSPVNFHCCIFTSRAFQFAVVFSFFLTSFLDLMVNVVEDTSLSCEEVHGRISAAFVCSWIFL